MCESTAFRVSLDPVRFRAFNEMKKNQETKDRMLNKMTSETIAKSTSGPKKIRERSSHASSKIETKTLDRKNPSKIFPLGRNRQSAEEFGFFAGSTHMAT
jgi:hypothetical protein